jgi:hypothetical protein
MTETRASIIDFKAFQIAMANLMALIIKLDPGKKTAVTKVVIPSAMATTQSILFLVQAHEL